jgi:hypothetical protein
LEICGGDMLIEGFISIEDSGIPAFVIKQPDANWDEVLLSGFLTSINDFCSLALDSGNLSNIQFQEKQVFFSFSNRLEIKFALIAKNSIPNDIAEYCLNELQEQYTVFFTTKGKKKKKKVTKTQSEKFSKNVAVPTIEKWETKALDLKISDD